MDKYTVKKTVNKIGMIARWQPVHLGHAAILRALCNHANEAWIGIGSSNNHNLRTPFTPKEISDMIRLVLAGRDNYTILQVPDLNNGPKWRIMVREMFGSLDLFITDNPYVCSLMSEDYPILHPSAIIPEAEKVPIDGTMVRKEMARGRNWQELVPPEVAQYILSNGLDDRFRREFGLQTLALETYLT